ncbi:MAG: hypothetical protein P4L33_19565, partial [Capsulimonadaceae bacterium]|nr:hypothetical protein [Capsulimonadaceae bacterium]
MAVAPTLLTTMAFFDGPKRALFMLAVIFALIGGSSALGAAKEDGGPFLRLENGMHSANINAVSIDRDKRYLATASDDKTVRVWSLESGQLLRTIRPPIGGGNIGQLYAVSISPDGSRIACAGWTSDPDSTVNHPLFDVYIYDRQTGASAAVISGLPNVPLSLAYSPDGGKIAVALGSSGIRLYETGHYKEIASDASFTGSIYALDFARTGIIVAGGIDHTLRLYDDNLRQISQTTLEHTPFSARFSPDGKHVAVGYADSGRITIFSIPKLSVVSTLNATETSVFSVVAWSANGTLYAGQQSTRERKACVVRTWPNFMSDRPQDSEPVNGGITQLAPINAEIVLFACESPRLGFIDSDRKMHIFQDAGIIDNRADQPDLLLSGDAATIGIVRPSGGLRFSMRDRSSLTFSANEAAARCKDLSPPVTSVPNAEVSSNTVGGIRVNGRQFSFPNQTGDRSNEIAYCHAFASDARTFVVGTAWSLYSGVLQNKDAAHFVFRIDVPAPVYHVNVSHDANVAVATLGDGTVRWYRLPDLIEICSFFPQADYARWVLHTPSGYYDCSAGGEDLIGWMVERPKSAADYDFFGASRFRNRYYRPDVLARVLTTLDEDKAVSEANDEARKHSGANSVPVVEPPANVVAIKHPPVVLISSPESGSFVTKSAVTISYEVHTASGAPPKDVRVLVDGRPTPFAHGNGQSATSISMLIPERDCKVSVIASDENGYSEPAIVVLYWKGVAPTPVVVPPPAPVVPTPVVIAPPAPVAPTPVVIAPPAPVAPTPVVIAPPAPVAPTPVVVPPPAPVAPTPVVIAPPAPVAPTPVVFAPPAPVA